MTETARYRLTNIPSPNMPEYAPFQTVLSRLHLHAVLPALEDLVDASQAAKEAARPWNFSLRMQLAGGAGATMVPRDGRVEVHPHSGPKPRLTLLFLSAAQLNRTFLNQSAMPPLPMGQIWRLTGLRPFTALTKLLDAALQPTAAALEDPAFLRMHLRLLFKVLMGAMPVIGEMDPPAMHTLAATPPGLAVIHMPALDLIGWARWDGHRLTAGADQPEGAPDAQIRFRDEATAAAALRSQLDAQAAVGLGQIEIQGLVPLADGLSVVMDRVETYLQPKP
jgi:hypothetical protein